MRCTTGLKRVSDLWISRYSHYYARPLTRVPIASGIAATVGSTFVVTNLIPFRSTALKSGGWFEITDVGLLDANLLSLKLLAPL